MIVAPLPADRGGGQGRDQCHGRILSPPLPSRPVSPVTRTENWVCSATPSPVTWEKLSCPAEVKEYPSSIFKSTKIFIDLCIMIHHLNGARAHSAHLNARQLEDDTSRQQPTANEYPAAEGEAQSVEQQRHAPTHSAPEHHVSRAVEAPPHPRS